MDNPLTEQGNNVYQPNEPVNICYDTFAPAAAMIRGLFECVYSAQGLDLIPHVPDSILELEQRDLIRLETSGSTSRSRERARSPL
jgi:hypothetical protein